MKRTTLLPSLFLFLFSCLFAGCVSLKKYKALEHDYQRCGEAQRTLEQQERAERFLPQNKKNENVKQ